jgi:membrane dipeptidase
MSMPILVDAHEDLAWNILTFGRDYSRSAHETRQIEKDSVAANENGNTLLGWPDYQRGQVAVVFSTLYAAPLRKKMGEWDTQAYADFESARRVYRAQADVYRRLIDQRPDQFRLIKSTGDLDSVLAHWQDPAQADHPVGLVMLMEGAEGVRSVDELPEWWDLGLRLIGPAWAGTRFCGGTREPGPLTNDGHELLAAMFEIGFTLDLSHMDRLAALESLDEYPGPIIASHANALALLPGFQTNRHLTDDVIDGIVLRDGVIGVVPANFFLKTGWPKKDGNRQEAPLELVVNQIDYICQRAGDARHAAIGSDFDGGFGLEHVPAELDTIADLQLLAPRLTGRGYSDADVAAIFGGNWINHLKKSLPAT